jgi:large subunit ribosomal protein L13
MAKVGEVAARWHLVNAEDKVLGRLASRLAMILMGKHRPEYTPHTDTGEFVVVINAEKVRMTGNKLTEQKYDWYTGYPGGYRTLTPEQMLVKHPTRLVYDAVRRMLPKTRMGTHMLTKLKIYAGPSHPHQAQKPEELKV